MAQLFSLGGSRILIFMADYVSLEGPLESIDGQLVLLIPLEAGGDKLAPALRRVQGRQLGDYERLDLPDFIEL